MSEISLAQLREVTGGCLSLGAPPPRDGELALLGPIVTDSRQVRPGDIFWALNGPWHQGADFASEAMARGAQGVVADRRVEPWAGAFAMKVEDTKLALWQMADWNRRRYDGFVVAVTGSVGKTTARQMIDTVLSAAGGGVASQQNFNNDIGVPLTLLRLKAEDDYAVVELGASAPREIDALARLTAPQVGVITRIGEAHLGGFGGIEKVAAAKGELLAVLRDHEHAVLCGDDAAQRRLAVNCRATVVWYGRSGDCDVAATEVRSGGGMLRFRVDQQQFEVPVWGRHHLDAALAAVAVGILYGRCLDEIAEALRSFEPVSMRCQVSDIDGATVINDAYNASPIGVRAALQLLAEMPTRGRRLALLGGMAELGAAAPRWHEEIGRQVVTMAGADALFTCGEYAAQMVAGATAAGMAPGRAEAVVDPLCCAAAVRDALRPGDVLLVKGSRVMALERVVDLLGRRELSQAA